MRNGALPQSYAPAGMSVFGRDSTVLPFRPVAAEASLIYIVYSPGDLSCPLACYKGSLHQRDLSYKRAALSDLRTSHVWQITGCQSSASKRSTLLFVGNVNARVEGGASHLALNL